MAEPYREQVLADGTPALRTLQDLIHQSGEHGQRVVISSEGGNGVIRLWDMVDQKWVGPFPRDGLSQQLAKPVVICSACHYSSPLVNRSKTIEQAELVIKEHIHAAKDATEQHRKAKIVEKERMGAEPFESCTGCGRTFTMIRQAAMKHLIRMREAAFVHAGAQCLLVNKYSLAPMALPVLPPVKDGVAQEPMNGGAANGRPETGQGVGSHRLRKRKRSRGRKRGEWRDNNQVGNAREH